VKTRNERKRKNIERTEEHGFANRPPQSQKGKKKTRALKDVRGFAGDRGGKGPEKKSCQKEERGEPFSKVKERPSPIFVWQEKKYKRREGGGVFLGGERKEGKQWKGGDPDRISKSKDQNIKGKIRKKKKKQVKKKSDQPKGLKQGQGPKELPGQNEARGSQKKIKPGIRAC